MKKICCIILFFAILFVNLRCIAFATAEKNTAKVKEFKLSVNKGLTSRKYLLGPNDVISVKFYSADKLDQNNLKIQPDGNVFLTPVGEIEAAGLTINEFRELLEEKYSYYVKNPRISVKLEHSRPFIVYVTGAVQNPGSYELNTNTTSTQYVTNYKPEIQIERKTPLLTNILVAAGGICYDADLEYVEINNSIDGSSYIVNLLELIEKGDSSQDVYLMAGDTVYVPKLATPLALTSEKYKKYASATFSPRFIPVKVFGYVNKPGLVKLDSADSLNINSAITSAGGYLIDSAYAPKKVILGRIDENGKLVKSLINPMMNDITLMPNDIVYVPEKTRPLIGKAFDYMTRVLTPVNAAAGSYNNWSLIFDPLRFTK
jgi:polysaccharide export outer membrane protein